MTPLPLPTLLLRAEEASPSEVRNTEPYSNYTDIRLSPFSLPTLALSTPRPTW